MSIDKKKILILGSGGHAKVVADTIEQAGEYQIAGFVDNINTGHVYLDYSVIGNDDQLKELFDSGITCAAMGIGYLGESNLRQRLYQVLKDIGFEMPAIIDRTAAVAKEVVLAEGAYVGKQAVVNSEASLGIMSIINSSAVVEHNCDIGDFSHVAVGATVCGGTYIGDATLIGAGAVVVQEKHIGNNVIVGAGSVVIDDVKDGQKVVGVPAKSI
ncbi:MAG: acetyltransferase [Lachnospiraceae bacterium]|nr:acetyltransferase [Lachnospiraceae bacterium]